MSQAPPPFTPQSPGFNSQATTNPSIGIADVGTQLDSNFSSISNALNATQTRLLQIQRDDGALRNGIVTRDALAPNMVFSGTDIMQSSITNYNLAAGSVDAVQIVDGAVGNAGIANRAVTSNKIAIGAVGDTQVNAISINKVTGLQTAINGKQPSGNYAQATHTHAIADVTGLQTALDAKQVAGSYAPLVHTHAITDVTGLQSALNAKLSDAPSDGSQYARKNGAWATVSGGSNGGSSTIPTNFTVHLGSGVTMGSYTDGNVIAAGTNIVTVVENMLTTVINPTISYPGSYISATGDQTVEYGSNVYSIITINFNRGSAVVNGNYANSTPLSGIATAYSISLDGYQVGTTQTYIYNTILTSAHTFTGYVRYAEGSQLTNNLGQNYGTPYPSGTEYDNNGVTFTPVRAMFYAANTATSAPITSADIRGLGSPDISGNTSFSISGATGATGLTIALPDGRTLTGVNSVQNGVSNPIPVINFQQSTVSVAGANNSTAASYNVYFFPILGGLGSAATFNITTT